MLCGNNTIKVYHNIYLLLTYFREACEGKSCTLIKYMSPNPTTIMNSTYNYGNEECYKYDAVITKFD